MTEPRLSCELVPSTAWWSNVRSEVSRAEWEKCKAYSKTKTNGTCIICGGVGDRWPTEAHEIWEYADDRFIQTLVDIWPLCTVCHQVKHLGRTRQVSNPEQWARVIEHMQRVNGWSDVELERYVLSVFEKHRWRSQFRWTLDLRFLATIGLEVPEVSIR